MVQKSTFQFLGKKILISFITILSCAFSFAQNQIVAENLLPGNPASEWDITLAGDYSIQGFATDISVDKGNTVHFKIDVQHPITNFRIKIYRLGYYQGNGARLIEDLGDFSGTPQPGPFYDDITGLTDCSNWSESASWNVPIDAVSGVYIVKLTRADNNGSSHMVFIVRDDSGNAPILFKTSDATWQAYNHYTGHSLYVGPTSTFSHAVKVSYNRPFYTRDGLGGGNGTKDWLFNAEYPMIRWMERNGYNISYTTDVDMDRDPTPITPAMHKILLSVGHDEYWSSGERTKFENARDAGVHLAFFSGNEVYWKTRWEDNHRTLVCYKEGTMGEYNCGGKCDPEPGEWTGIWRDGCSPPYEPNNGCKIETPLSGQLSWSNSRGSIEVPAIYKNMGFWRNTSIAGSTTGQTVILPYGTLGDEWDAYQDEYASTYPGHRVLLSSTFLNGQNHNLSLYRSNSGALVFGAGTMQWSWGLDENHDNGNSPPSADMQQATVNLFADMGVMPVTLQSGLIASVSGDNQPPSTVITNPSNGVILPGSVVIITGTAADAGGGIVAGVEVSTDGGTSWFTANGTSNWFYSWQPAVPGVINILTRAWDDLANLEVTGNPGSDNNISVSITGEIYNTVFQSITPSSTSVNFIGDGTRPLEVGMKFRSIVNGFISGFRYYKGVGAQGVHIGNLWSSAGANLASATFTGETVSGWQTVNLATPIAILADSIYVVSYFSAHGDYVKTDPYFISDFVSGPLTALMWTAEEPNGVYAYSGSPAFPNISAFIGSSNYWADVLFTTTLPLDYTPPTVVSVFPDNNSTTFPITGQISATFSESLDPITVNSSTFIVTGPGSVPVSGSVGNSGVIATFTPDLPLAYATTYVATLMGGATDPRIKDLAENALVADFSWQVVTESLIIPGITLQPVSQNACNESNVNFFSVATGIPSPTVQWQVSSDNGSSWQDIDGAIASPYVFTVAAIDNAKQFRAVWTNSQGSANSAPATLTIIPSITATISVVSASTCPGSPFQLLLSEANSQTPYDVVVNGKTYNGVTVGQAFTSISTSDESIWSASSTPQFLSQPDGAATELGVRFRAAVDGYVKGIRFYKGPGNTGTHTGSLWTSGGTSLATATFINETTTGWQEVQFTTPVAISANNTYVASYFTAVGHYSKNSNYFAVARSNGSQLQAPAANEVNGNGVYLYGSGFPTTASPQSDNYWVDVIFSYSNSKTVFNNNLTSISDNGGCTSTANPLSSSAFTLNSAITAAPAVSNPVTYCQYATAAPLTASGTNLYWYSTSTGGTGSSAAPIPSTEIHDTTSYFVSQSITGCESPRTEVVVFVNPTPSAPTVEQTQPTCSVATGEISITAPEGVGMEYSIDGTTYQGSLSFEALSAGSYSVTAKNSFGCISVANIVTINQQPVTPDSPTAELIQPGCLVPTGTITVTSPVSELFFSIDGTDYTNTTGIFTGVLPGTYSLTAKNSSNCNSPATVLTLDIVPGSLSAPIADILQPDCFTGTGTVTVTSVLSGLSFSINGSDFSNTTGIFSEVVPGTYILYAKNNSDNCLSPPAGITVFSQPVTPNAPSANVTQPTCSLETGTITVTLPATDLFFSIDGINYVDNSGIFTEVAPGTYNLSARNISNCISEPTSISVIAAPPVPTGVIEVVSNSTCPGSPFELQLSSATGQSPFSLYNLVINGTAYEGLSIGQTFATISTGEESIWTDFNIPHELSTSDHQPVEVGVKFRASADGYIHGIRFYKGYGNEGEHLGSLWTTTGTLLANATFINETFSGWQEVRFDTPVAISANTIYIASYYAPSGHYARDQYYFSNAHSNGSMLLATGASGTDGNGVYQYGGGFPGTNAADLANFWVDVIYSYSNNNMAFVSNLTTISENGGCSNTSSNPPLSSAVVNLVYPPAPIVTAPVSYCLGAVSAPLSATGTDLLWYSSIAVGTGSAVAPTPSTAIAGIKSYFVSQTVSGCESPRGQVDVVVNPLFTAGVTIIADNNNICEGTTITFTATPTNGGAEPAYQWYNRETPVGLNSTVFAYTPVNGDLISVVMTSDATLCLTGYTSTSDSITMIVNPVLTAGVAIAPGANPVTLGTIVTFIATPVNGGIPSYQWYVNGLAVGGTESYAYAPENNDQVFVIMTSSISCVTSATATSDTVIMIVNSPVVKSLNVNVFLQGLYNGGGTMRKAQDEFGDHFSGNTADVITIELHDAANYEIISYSSENINVSTSGSASITIPANLNGSYYITVKHRNSIETTTATAISFAGDVIGYNFDEPSKAYGNNLGMMIDGWWVLYGGDVNQDGIVDTGDMSPIDNDSFNYMGGYLNSDTNGDGIVDTADMTIVDNNAINYISSLHP